MSRSTASAAGPSSAAPFRAYLDASGQLWTVREPVDTSSWARGRPSLVFASDMAIRRVWTCAAHWSSLSDTALEMLSWAT